MQQLEEKINNHILGVERLRVKIQEIGTMIQIFQKKKIESVSSHEMYPSQLEVIDLPFLYELSFVNYFVTLTNKRRKISVTVLK